MSGTPNKNTELRERIQVTPEEIEDDIREIVDPAKRAELKIKLLEFKIPKPQRVTIETIKPPEKQEIVVSFMDPSEDDPPDKYAHDHFRRFMEIDHNEREKILSSYSLHYTL